LQREILITNVAPRTFPDDEVPHVLIQDAKEKIARLEVTMRRCGDSVHKTKFGGIFAKGSNKGRRLHFTTVPCLAQMKRLLVWLLATISASVDRFLSTKIPNCC